MCAEKSVSLGSLAGQQEQLDFAREIRRKLDEQRDADPLMTLAEARVRAGITGCDLLLFQQIERADQGQLPESPFGDTYLSNPGAYIRLAELPIALGLTVENVDRLIDGDSHFPAAHCTPDGPAYAHNDIDRWRFRYTHDELRALLESLQSKSSG